MKKEEKATVICAKRILSLLLAVVLIMSALPFSVSADEIIISDFSGDVPVLYAIDPFDEIQNITQGGTDYLTQFGISRAKIERNWKPKKTTTTIWGLPTPAVTGSLPTAIPVTTMEPPA